MTTNLNTVITSVIAAWQTSNHNKIHNKKVITEKKTQTINCNCINKPHCPFPTNAKL